MAKDVQELKRSSIGPKEDLNSTINLNEFTKPVKSEGISISGFNPANVTTAEVHINGTTGESTVEGLQNSDGIVLNRKRRVVRRSPNEVKKINPNDFIPPKEKNTTTVKDKVRDTAYNDLIDTVNRKRDEYKQFVEYAIEQDKINRQKIEDGLETVNEKEVVYRPDDVLRQEKIKRGIASEEDYEAEERNKNDDFDSEKDELEELNIESDGFTRGVSRRDPFASFMQEEKEEDSHMENNENIQFEDVDFEKEMVNEIEKDFVDEEVVTEEVENPPYVEEDEDDGVDDVEDDDIEEDIEEEDSSIEETVEDDVEDDGIDDAPEDEEEDDAPVEEVVEPEEVVNEVPDKKETPKMVPASEADSRAINDLIIDKMMKEGSKVITVKNDFGPIDEKDAKNTVSDDVDSEDPDENVSRNVSDEEYEKIAQKRYDELNAEILQKVILAGRKMNINSYAMSNNVINVGEALRTDKSKAKVVKKGSFPLLGAGRNFTATALKGSEVAMLMSGIIPTEEGYHITRAAVEILYQHDANPYKPATSEAWAKTIPFSDLEYIFAALYIASLEGANYFPRECEERACQYQYLDTIDDLSKYIQFSSDKAKARYEEVKNIEPTPENSGSYESVLSQITDDYAASIRIPTIYTNVYENAAVNDDFRRKYNAMYSMCGYIDHLYKINHESNQLFPIGWKTYPGDSGKSFRSKVSTYAKILQNFTDGEFSILTALINAAFKEINENGSIVFEIPKANCPKCGVEMNSIRVNPIDLVFIRQRLVNRATSYIER